MFVVLCVFAIVQYANTTLFAVEGASRFPYLSRLPEKSLVRQKCLASSDKPWFFKSYVQIACEDLEKECKYSAEKFRHKLRYDMPGGFRDAGENIEAILHGSYFSTLEKANGRHFSKNEFRERRAVMYLNFMLDNEASAEWNLDDDIPTMQRYARSALQAGNPIAAKSWQDKIKLVELYKSRAAENKGEMEVLYAAEDTAEETEPTSENNTVES